MATENQFSVKAVEGAQEVLSDLKAKAKVAHETEDVFMMSIMTELISVASPIVTKAVARLNREERSRINAAHKELRAKKRETPTEPPREQGARPPRPSGNPSQV